MDRPTPPVPNRLSQEPYDAFRHPRPFSEKALPPAARIVPCAGSETDKELTARAALPGVRRAETRAGERMFETESGRGLKGPRRTGTGRVNAQPILPKLR